MSAKILVVDDDRAVLDVVSRVLAAAGHVVETADSGERALQRLQEPFDVVLTDLGLPGRLDGGEVTRRFRAAGSADVIVMTGSPELASSIQALRDGAYDYLSKPLTRTLLEAVVARCLEKRRLSRELAREKALRSELHRLYFELSDLHRIRELFGQFATPEVAKTVMRERENFWRRGKRVRVTVMFADIRGFTAHSARVPPEQATRDVNMVFSIMQDAICRAGGILNKFLGDGVMALFGAPVALPRHEAAAAEAALEALRAMDRANERRVRDGLPALSLGIGINTGEVMAGCLGTRERMEYSVIGSAINIAARLEKNAEPGQILVGPETRAAIEGPFAVKDLGAMALRNLPEPVSVCALVGRTAGGVSAPGSRRAGAGRRRGRARRGSSAPR